MNINRIFNLAIKKMKRINRRRALSCLPVTGINLILQSIFGTPLVWSARGSFSLRSWHPVQVKDWDRHHESFGKNKKF